MPKDESVEEARWRLSQEAVREADGRAAHPLETVHLSNADLERLEAVCVALSGPLAIHTASMADERDAYREQLTQAQALNNRLTKALAYLVKEWPQTSWGSSNEAHDTAQALLDELAGEGATMGTPDPATVQENRPHAPSHQDPADA